MSRGLCEIRLGGETFTLVPSWQAYRDIEARTDHTIKELLSCALHERLKLEEAGAIVYSGALAANERITDIEAVMMSMHDTRLSDLQLRRSIIKFLLALIYTPEEATKKFDAEVDQILMEQAETI
jgi:hypothetical protein